MDKKGKNKVNNLKDLFNEIDNDKKKKGKKTKPNFNNIQNNISYNNNFKGLKNFGNSCYSNVVIQILTSINEFLQIINKMYKIIENDDNLMLDYPILSRLQEIIRNYKIKNTSIASNFLKEIVYRFDQTGNQNDAHEFLVFLLDNLNLEMIKIESKYKDLFNNKNNLLSNNNNDEGEWEEVKKGGKRMKQINSIEHFEISELGKIFQGIIKQDISEKGKSISNCQIEPFFILGLNVESKTLNGMLDIFFSRKKIEDSEKYTQTFIEKLPNILIIRVKGFYYDKKIFQIIKIRDPLIFDEVLDIKKSYFSPFLQNENFKYELIGLIVHKGNQANEGHYICYCKDNETKNWYYLDDSKVISVGNETIHNLRPYVMFFRKI